MSKSQLSVGTSPLKNTILNELDLGATCDYCPVSLVNKNILVKGNMNYCVEYCNKYMVLDSQENLDQFLIEPQKYYFEHKIPQVPPPRICFLGPNSKAKIQFAKALGEILEVPVYFSNKEWKPNMQSFQSRLELDFLDYKSEFSIQEIMKEKTTYSTGFILCGYSFDRKSTIEKAEYYPEAVFVFDEEDNLTRILNKHGPLERSNSIISRTDVKQLDDTFTQNYRYKSVESLNESVSYKRKNSRLRAKQVIELILQSIEEDIKFYKQLDYPIINIPSSFIDPLVVQKIISKYAKAINNNTDRATLFYVPRRIDLDTALKCVDCGYYRKSRFGLSCPARRVPVPDERFDFLCEYHKPLSKVPAYLNVVDIAGLVKGASEGQGLGNAFLSHISACDAIFHLCRVFEDTNVTHIEGEVDPVRDLDIITEELRLKDEEKLLQNLEKLEKTYVRGGDKKLKQEYDSMIKIKQLLMDEKKCLRFSDWNAHDIEALNKHLFLTSKPVIYLVNLSEKDFIRKKNKWLIKIKEWVDKNDPGATIIPFSGAFESQLMEMDDAERKAYEEEHKCKSNLDKIIIQGYKALQLEYFFTAGHDEVKAWTILKGTKAPQAAGRIHTDFEKGFIMAEVMHYKDFKEEGSEASCKSAGKYRQQGRNYGVEDGDIIFFKFNAGAGLKDPKKK